MNVKHSIEMHRHGIAHQRRQKYHRQANDKGYSAGDVSEGVEEPLLKAALFSGF